MDVTKENIHDVKMLKGLVSDIATTPAILKKYWPMVPMILKITLGILTN